MATVQKTGMLSICQKMTRATEANRRQQRLELRVFVISSIHFG